MSLKLARKSGTMPRLHLSSKSIPGVLEDMDIADGPGDGVRLEKTSIWSFCESFIKIKLKHINNLT